MPERARGAAVPEGNAERRGRTGTERIRRARETDLAGIIALEQAAFQPWRQSSPASLRRSVRSPHQSVWVIGAPAACLVLWHRPRTLRVYGIAVHPAHQGEGLGRALMAHAESLARKGGQERIVLEADATDRRLLAWYEVQGYEKARRLVDFYAPRRHAWRLEKRV